MRTTIRLLLAMTIPSLLLGIVFQAVGAQTASVPITPQQDAKIKKIEGRVMAPCCYTQTIRDHDSQVAEEMRDEVKVLVLSGKSEQEIVTYYKTKYGETVLVVPDGMAGRLAFGIPVAVPLLSSGILVFIIRKSVKTRALKSAQNFPDQSEAEQLLIRQRIQADLGEEFW